MVIILPKLEITMLSKICIEHLEISVNCVFVQGYCTYTDYVMDMGRDQGMLHYSVKNIACPLTGKLYICR